MPSYLVRLGHQLDQLGAANAVGLQEKRRQCDWLQIGSRSELRSTDSNRHVKLTLLLTL